MSRAQGFMLKGMGLQGFTVLPFAGHLGLPRW